MGKTNALTRKKNTPKHMPSFCDTGTTRARNIATTNQINQPVESKAAGKAMARLPQHSPRT